jgi:hypothetical protein
MEGYMSSLVSMLSTDLYRRLVWYNNTFINLNFVFFVPMSNLRLLTAR